MGDTRIWLMVATVALVTAALRFLPFLIFKGEKKTPPLIEKLGRLLPYAIMGMLVVYCMKGLSFRTPGGYLPALISCAVVALTYLWRKNTLISIVAGTVLHMVLVQFVF